MTERKSNYMTPKDCITKFRSVRIIHDIINKISYCYLAEFFRFIGVLVYEDSMADYGSGKGKTETENNTSYNACIYIGERAVSPAYAEKLGISKTAYENYVKNLADETIYLYDIIDRQLPGKAKKQNGLFQREQIFSFSQNEQKELLLEIISRIFDQIFQDKGGSWKIAGQMAGLADIYVKQHICFHSMNLQYYAKRASRATAEAKEAFIDSRTRVKEEYEKNAGSCIEYIYEYALLWCEIKANSACNFAKEILYYPIKNLSERCIAYYDKYPYFDNAGILLGLCYEPSLSHVNQALTAFNKVIRSMGKESFLASVYYWMGKRYEVFESAKQNAKQCYQLANECRRKFRTYFKLAVIARNEDKYDEAIDLFGIIIHGLDLKQRLEFTDPLEIEYLFKSYTQQAYAYYKQEKYEKAIETGEAALAIKKSIEKNRYFEKFYGTMAEEYRGILEKRQCCDTAYRLIESAKRKLEEQQEQG